MVTPLVSELQRLEHEGHKFEDSLTGMNMFERETELWFSAVCNLLR